jgi:hypothetical protein
LKIYTTIDSRLQTHAEEAVSEHIKAHQAKLWKDQKRNKKAPFRDLTEAEIESIMLQAMRRSTRYNERLDERQDIRERYRGYFKYKKQRNEYESEMANLYKQFERAERMEKKDDQETIKKKLEKLRRKNKKLQPDLDRTWDYYQEPWKPFDDSLRAEFNHPVEMSIYSWEREIDTILSPMDSIRYYKHFLQTGVISMDPKLGLCVLGWGALITSTLSTIM